MQSGFIPHHSTNSAHQSHQWLSLCQPRWCFSTLTLLDLTSKGFCHDTRPCFSWTLSVPFSSFSFEASSYSTYHIFFLNPQSIQYLKPLIPILVPLYPLTQNLCVTLVTCSPSLPTFSHFFVLPRGPTLTPAVRTPTAPLTFTHFSLSALLLQELPTCISYLPSHLLSAPWSVLTPEALSWRMNLVSWLTIIVITFRAPLSILLPYWQHITLFPLSWFPLQL